LPASPQSRLDTTFVYVTHDQVEAMTMATQIVVLNHGRIEQSGSPSQVYDQPASAFVASFVGSPAMNLIPAKVSAKAGTVRLVGSGFETQLWPGQTEPIDVIFGVRPEHLRVLVPGEEAEIEFLMAVDSVENLGHEEAVYGLAEGTRICLRRPRGWPQVRLGVRRVGFDRRHLHLFERTSGRRLEWVPDGVDHLELTNDVQQALAGVA
jgi:multiple sugar transport system ATP-binding protein